MTAALVESLHLDAPTKQALQTLSERGSLSTWPPASNSPPQHLTWTAQPETRHTTAIVSSRLGRQLDQKEAFFRVFRIACAQLHPQRQVLVSAEGTATHRYLTRAADLFGIDLRTWVVAKTRQSLQGWATNLQKLDNSKATHRVFVSPPLQGDIGEYPLRDELVIRAADQVLAIHVRDRGAIAGLLRERLQGKSPGRVFLALGDPMLVGSEVADPLMACGAVGWYVNTVEDTAGDRAAPHWNATDHIDAATIIEDASQLADHDRFLCHCTRSPDGPWPHQSESDYLDELILGATVRDRSAFSALRRIVAQRRILATGAAIRKGIDVVSLTAVPLPELPRLRRFRSHRGRWDFEPYGIAVDRDYLAACGTKQVIYGDEATWQSLTPEEQPYFQKVSATPNAIDWRQEKEWRLVGDLNLAEVPHDQARVFVPSREEAEHIASISNWPIVIL